MAKIARKQLVEVDGRRLEFALQGSGRPVVVFINGGGPVNMDSWSTIFDAVTDAGTLFAYNRFGEGRSARVGDPQTGPVVVANLRKLLRAVDLDPPYILVGHSLGGLYANLFARRHPDETAGVVLVDSSHPEQGGLVREMRTRPLNRLVMKAYGAINPVKFSEVSWFDTCPEDFAAAGPFPDVPLVVVTAGKRVSAPGRRSREIMQAVAHHQEKLAAMSPQGTQAIATGRGHFVQRDAPEVVVEAIRSVAARVREVR